MRIAGAIRRCSDLDASGLPLAVDRRDSPVLVSGTASDHHNVQITQRLGHLNPFRPFVRSYLRLGGIATSSARIVAAIAAARPVTHLAPPSWPLKAGMPRTAKASSRPSQAALTQIQWPIHQAMSCPFPLPNPG